MDKLHSQIKKARLDVHLSQSEAAVIAKLTQQAVSRIETKKGTSIEAVNTYLNCFGKELTVSDVVPEYFAVTELFQKYEKASSLTSCIVSHVGALEALGYFSGFVNEYPVEMYCAKEISVPGVICNVCPQTALIGSVYSHGVFCTDPSRTFSDVLENAWRIDDGIILESLNYYYFKNGNSFDGLRLTPYATSILKAYAEDAINNC